jgi:hypothetical protein
VGDALGRSWDARNAEDDNFPFRSVIGEGTGAGKAELHAALSYLTFRGSDDAELRPLVPSVPVAGVGKGDGQPQPAQPVSRDVPAGLLKRTPDTYLELQLPAWAYRFTEEFHRREYFERDGRRGKALRAIVRARADAERALDLDRRGLSWIGPFIRDGDEVRRVVQDELFTGTREDHLSNDWTPRVEKVRSFYKRALDASEAFRKARETWEAAAAELPWLVEWAIRHESHRPGSTFVPTDPFPADVETAMRDFASLSAVLAADPRRGSTAGSMTSNSGPRPLERACRGCGTGFRRPSIVYRTNGTGSSWTPHSGPRSSPRRSGRRSSTGSNGSRSRPTDSRRSRARDRRIPPMISPTRATGSARPGWPGST